MTRRELKNRHFFHIVNNSPWPFLISIITLSLAFNAMFWFHFQQLDFFLYSFFSTVFIMFLWFRDVVREGTFEGNHSIEVQKNLRYGMFLFIVSEIMFFFSFFWAFFHSSLAPTLQIGVVWPPIEIETLATWSVPALNTFVLLTSGATITWVHFALLRNDRKEALQGFLFTLFLAVLFTAFQVMEYFESSYHINDSVYGSVFFLMTGFHGIHVIIGTLFVLVCFFRFLSFHFTSKHHIGFQSAAWYWHFVDVVWIFLFTVVYVWGNTSIFFKDYFLLF